jgi:hypothetical protein
MEYKNLTAIMSDLSEYADETSTTRVHKIAKFITVRGNKMVLLMTVDTDYVSCALVGTSDELTAIIESKCNDEYKFSTDNKAILGHMWDVIVTLISKHGILLVEHIGSEFSEN